MWWCWSGWSSARLRRGGQLVGGAGGAGLGEHEEKGLQRCLSEAEAADRETRVHDRGDVAVDRGLGAGDGELPLGPDDGQAVAPRGEGQRGRVVGGALQV